MWPCACRPECGPSESRRHVSAVLLGDAAGMQAALLLAAALADPTIMPDFEVRSAMGACLSAIIDKAPVGNIKGQHVEIRRETNPDACTISVDAGEPAEVRAAAVEAITRRKEGFAPAKTAWDPAAFASRETFCSAPRGRAFNVLVSTAKPGEPLSLTATVFEAKERDSRCDRDEGVQRPIPPPANLEPGTQGQP